MGILVNIQVGHFAYGNPASLGEPLGLFEAEAQVTGDVTGTTVRVGFQPQNPAITPTLADQRRQYVYFVDGIRMTSTADPGNWGIRGEMHMARANSALPPFTLRTAGDMVQVNDQLFVPDRIIWPESAQRMAIFWDTQELAVGQQNIVFLTFQNNVDAQVYDFGVYGRYYDRQVLSNRSFGRLISPPPVAPFG